MVDHPMERNLLMIPILSKTVHSFLMADYPMDRNLLIAPCVSLGASPFPWQRDDSLTATVCFLDALFLNPTFNHGTISGSYYWVGINIKTPGAHNIKRELLTHEYMGWLERSCHMPQVVGQHCSMCFSGIITVMAKIQESGSTMGTLQLLPTFYWPNVI